MGQLRVQYSEANGGEWPRQRGAKARHQLLPWALAQAESHNAPHIGVLDWVLYGIRAQNIRFG
jgi:hypothetical protein